MSQTRLVEDAKPWHVAQTRLVEDAKPWHVAQARLVEDAKPWHVAQARLVEDAEPWHVAQARLVEDAKPWHVAQTRLVEDAKPWHVAQTRLVEDAKPWHVAAILSCMAYSVADISGLFPNLMDIKDAGLRAKVAAVWDEALRGGCAGKGWTFDEIRAIPFTLLAGKIDLRFVEHLNSCCKQCIAIAGVLKEVFGGRVPVNLDVLIAGSLLADVGKMLEFDKGESGQVVKGRFGDLLRHPFSGVALCYKHGIPAEVMHIVATHSHEGDKVERTIESWIFHHADFIDFDIAKVLGKAAK